MIIALRDPIGANLDRVQVIKGWVDSNGKSHEKIYEVAWSGERAVDANGKLGPVGNTVDLETATWSNSIGAPELATVWRDPDFRADRPAVYYARVLENPSCRWSQQICAAAGVRCDDPATIPEGMGNCCAAEHQKVIQERAWTSPIWYTPPS